VTRRLLVEGGTPLQGEVAIQGAKNAAQKILPATILWPGTYVIRHLPLIEDTRALLSILRFLGAHVTFLEPHCVQIDTEDVRPLEIPPELTALSTGTFLFAGALLGRFGEAKVWHPGGDRIGKRPVTWHLDAFRRLGATVREEAAYYEVRGTRLCGGSISFARPTANGAINAVMTALRAQGTSCIKPVAPEPEIRQALHFFEQTGALIRWQGDYTLEVEGPPDHDGSREGTIDLIPDRNDAATFLIAGVLGHGPVTLQRVLADHLLPLLEVLQRCGANLEISSETEWQTITVRCEQIQAGDIQITSRPFPGFSSDWGALVQVLLTQVPGTHLFHETIFARRFAHVPELVTMGAAIQPCALPVDEAVYNFPRELIAPPAHAVSLSGPQTLRGAHVRANDVRAGAALVLAGLVAEGQTVVSQIEQIERGYESLDERLRQLGTSITLLS
jgi:UDP-N-acetylglucosamine 1-carboxyvinyltransferase